MSAAVAPLLKLEFSHRHTDIALRLRDHPQNARVEGDLGQADAGHAHVGAHALILLLEIRNCRLEIGRAHV